MSVKVDTMQGIKARLTTYTASGSALDFVKSITFGSEEESRQAEDLPYITIQLVSGEEINKYNHGGMVDEMQFSISLVTNKLAYEESNHLYNVEYELGIIYQIEDLMNSLEKDPDTGAMDLNIDGTNSELPTMSYNILYGDFLTAEITYTVRTNQFQGGSR